MNKYSTHVPRKVRGHAEDVFKYYGDLHIRISKSNNRDRSGNLICPNCGAIVGPIDHWGNKACSCGAKYYSVGNTVLAHIFTDDLLTPIATCGYIRRKNAINVEKIVDLSLHKRHGRILFRGYSVWAEKIVYIEPHDMFYDTDVFKRYASYYNANGENCDWMYNRNKCGGGEEKWYASNHDKDRFAKLENAVISLIHELYALKGE